MVDSHQPFAIREGFDWLIERCSMEIGLLNHRVHVDHQSPAHVSSMLYHICIHSLQFTKVNQHTNLNVFGKPEHPKETHGVTGKPCKLHADSTLGQDRTWVSDAVWQQRCQLRHSWITIPKRWCIVTKSTWGEHQDRIGMEGIYFPSIPRWKEVFRFKMMKGFDSGFGKKSFPLASRSITRDGRLKCRLIVKGPRGTMKRKVFRVVLESNTL